MSRSLRTVRASSPMTTTTRGWTIASSSTTRATQPGSASDPSPTGHLTPSLVDLPAASALARRTPHAPGLARLARGRRRGLGLEELERLHVQQRGRLRDDLGAAQRLQELLRPVEVAHPHAHRAKPLRN